MEEKQAYPSFLQAIGLMCMFFIGAIVFVFISKYLQITKGTVVYALAKETISIFVYYSPIYYAMGKNSTTFKQALGNFTSTKGYIIPTIIVISGYKYILLPIEYFLKYFLYGITEYSLENTIIDFIELPFAILLLPVFEEVLFRGLILRSFLKRYSIIKSIILSSVLFGVLHIYPTAILNATLISIMISYLYIKTKSVWICIIAHSITNIIPIGYFNYLLMHYLHFNLSTYVITGIIFAATGLYLLNKACSKHLNEEASTGIEA